MHLDTFTVVFIGFVQSLCIAAGFSLILLVLRRRDVARLWSYALWLVPAGAAILSLRGHLPELPAILIGNGCFTLSMLFLLQGVAGIPRLNQSDGIHPNDEGERIVTENVWRSLEPVLTR